MTKEEALRVANEIAQRVLTFGENAAREADAAVVARVEAKHADEEHAAHMRERNRANRLAGALKQLREILGAKDGESVQEAARRVVADHRDTAWMQGVREILGAREGESVLDAARRCAQSVRPWRPIAELVKDGRRVEVWNGTAPTFAHADFGNSAVYTHFREIDPTKPEGVA